MMRWQLSRDSEDLNFALTCLLCIKTLILKKLQRAVGSRKMPADISEITQFICDALAEGLSSVPAWLDFLDMVRDV